MGGALQAIARSSPARGARMEGREGGQQGGAEVKGGRNRGGWGGRSYCITTCGHESSPENRNTDGVFVP